MTDRYSDNHKIAVGNGAGTLTLDADVAVTGDLSVTGDLAFDGLITGSVNTTTELVLSVAASHIAVIPAAELTSGFTATNIPSSAFFHLGAYVYITSGACVFYKNISDRIPNGAAISNIKLVSYVGASGDEVTLTLMRQPHNSTASSTMKVLGPKSHLSITTDTSTGLVLNNTIDYSGYFYYLKLNLGVATTAAYCAGIMITYSTSKYGQ